MEFLRFIQCSNLSDMASAKPGFYCCLGIHSLVPSKPVQQHNAASWCSQWIMCSDFSLSVSQMGHFEWFFYFQCSIHLPTPHINHECFDIHHCFHIDISVAACWNTGMSVSTFEMSLLCDDQYFKLRYLDVIFFIVLAKYEVIVYVLFWYFIVVGWIALDMALWVWCVAPACIWRHR